MLSLEVIEFVESIWLPLKQYWQESFGNKVIAVLLISFLIFLVVSIVGGYTGSYYLGWVGVGDYSPPPGLSANAERGKTLWDWMELLIIPLVLVVGGFFLNRSQRQQDQKFSKNQEEERALEGYLEAMTKLLLERDLRTSEEAKSIARSRTLTVLTSLNSERKSSILRFLYEAKLIGIEKAVVNLTEANLEKARLGWANLTEADLTGAILTEADLTRAKLIGANLKKADLSGDNLKNANLMGANLEEVMLGEVNLMAHLHLKEGILARAHRVEVNLVGANLTEANLQNARLMGAHLRGANLVRADLTKADLTEADLMEAKLIGANLVGANLEKAMLVKADLMGAKYNKDTTWPLEFNSEKAGARKVED
jgi:uncharacterized protein YjbI with pentapeptide repeats